MKHYKTKLQFFNISLKFSTISVVLDDLFKNVEWLLKQMLKPFKRNNL